MHSKVQVDCLLTNYLCTEYRLISKKGEGTFSEVLKAQSTKTNKYVAIKCMKAHFYNIDQVSVSTQLFYKMFVRWITWGKFKLWNVFRHIRISSRFTKFFSKAFIHIILFVTLNTTCACSDEPTGRLALVFELMDMNMYEAVKGRRHYLPEQRVKYYMYQVLKAIDHMHRNGIFHRDIKP